MKKKYISAAIIIAMCTSIYGCGNSTTSASIPSTSSTTHEASDINQIPQSDSKNNADTITESDDSATLGERNALKKALQYLNTSAFSYDSLVHQLEYEGFEHADAVYGADNCGADWQEQAHKKAQQYLDTSAFSAKSLAHQLEYEGFSSEMADNAVKNCGADWKEQAAKKAAQYLETSAFSRDSLLHQLEYEGFTSDEALYGVQAVGY